MILHKSHPHTPPTCALDTACTDRTSSPTRGLKPRAFTTPVSTTYRTPGMVIDVSAILVDRMTLREPWGVGWNTRCCCDDGRAANRGHMRRLSQCVGKRSEQRSRVSCTDSISSLPVRNTRMSPIEVPVLSSTWWGHTVSSYNRVKYGNQPFTMSYILNKKLASKPVLITRQ